MLCDEQWPYCTLRFLCLEPQWLFVPMSRTSLFKGNSGLSWWSSRCCMMEPEIKVAGFGVVSVLADATHVCSLLWNLFTSSCTGSVTSFETSVVGLLPVQQDCCLFFTSEMVPYLLWHVDTGSKTPGLHHKIWSSTEPFGLCQIIWFDHNL